VRTKGSQGDSKARGDSGESNGSSNGNKIAVRSSERQGGFVGLSLRVVMFQMEDKWHRRTEIAGENVVGS